MRVPPAIQAFVEGSRFDPISIGKSGASVFRVTSPAGVMFLKSAESKFGGLSAEAERLRWIAGKLPVPDVVSFASDDSRDYLLVTSLPGVNGVEAGRERPSDVVTGLAKALKILHGQPVAKCPFDQSVTSQIERARQRVRAGLIDEADFDEERLGCTAADLLVELEGWRHDDEARVLTHGDPSLPNVMFDEGRFTGFIDCSRFGAADPYQDLALAARSVAFNLGHDWVAVFFQEYGLPNPDRRKLAFYRLVDEFF